jgi:hypothetical protein
MNIDLTYTYDSWMESYAQVVARENPGIALPGALTKKLRLPTKLDLVIADGTSPTGEKVHV